MGKLGQLLFLSWILGFGLALADESTDSIQIDSQDFEKFTETQKSKLDTYTQSDRLDRITEAYQKFVAETQAQMEKMGETEFQAAVEKDKVFSKSDELKTKSEMNSIDGKNFVRVVDFETEAEYALLDRKQINPKSKHLSKYIARQHIDAGRGRKDGKIGRDVILIWHENGVFDREKDLQFLFIPEKLSFEYMKDWRLATLKKPTRGDLILGTACGMLQAGVTYCMCKAQLVMNPGGPPMDLTSTYMSAGFGFMIGIFYSSYRNIMYRGSKFAQNAKTWVLSLAFAYPLTYLTQGGWAALDPTTMLGFMAHSRILFNTVMNNMTKVELNQFVRFRTIARENAGTIQIPMGKDKYFDTEVSKASAENQAIYLLPYGFKMADLTQFSIPLGNGWSLPVGRILMTVAVPIAQWLTVIYAEKKGYPEAPELRQRWERQKNFVTGQWGKLRNPVEPVDCASLFAAFKPAF